MRSRQTATSTSFRVTGTVPKFDGFLKVYEEAKDSARTRKTRR